jgi:methionyl-tRNA formyltransferase
MSNKILYIGYEPRAVNYILENIDNKVVAVAKMNILSPKSINPINLLFFGLYFFRQKKSKNIPLFESFLAHTCYLFSFGVSGVFKRYKTYILKLYENNIEVWDINDKNSIERIKKNIDLIIVNIWELIDKNIFNAPRLGSINIHPSKLPKYIGAVPTLWALKNKDSESAVTYIYISENGVDRGDIVRQEAFAINTNDNIINIEEKVMNIIHNTINNVITDVVENKIVLIKQNFNLSSKTPKYENYKEIKVEEETSQEILNKVIGYPYVIYGEYCYVKYKHRLIYLKNLHLQNNRFLSSKLNYFISGIDKKPLYAKLFIDVSIFDSLYILFNKIK